MRKTVRSATVNGGSDEIVKAVENNEGFGAGGTRYGPKNFTGEFFREGEASHESYGRLEGAEYTLFLEQRPRITYIIRSYFTPIAWRYESENGPVWHVVNQRFSPSTTRHQSAASYAIYKLGGEKL